MEVKQPRKYWKAGSAAVFGWRGRGLREDSDHIFRSKPGTPGIPLSPVKRETLGQRALLFPMVLTPWRNGFARNIWSESSAELVGANPRPKTAERGCWNGGESWGIGGETGFF